MTTVIAELLDTSFYQVLFEESTVEFWSNALKGDTQKVFLCLQQSLSDRIALNMPDTLNLLECRHETIISSNKIGVSIIESQNIVNLDMSAKTYHLITDGVFEPKYHTYGDNHHSQTDGNTNGGNTNGRTTDFSFVALITVYFSGYE